MNSAWLQHGFPLLWAPRLTKNAEPGNGYVSSVSFLSSSSSESSSSSVSDSSFFASSAFLASSSSFFFSFSTSLRSFHFFTKASASATSSVMITLSKIVPPLTCQRSKPIKSKSSYLYRASSSSYSGLSICLAAQTPLYSGFEMRFTYHSPLYAGLSFVGASHSPSSSSSQSSGFFASLSTMRLSSTQSSGFLSSGSSIIESSTQSPGFLSSGSEISFGLKSSQSSLMDPS